MGENLLTCNSTTVVQYKDYSEVMMGRIELKKDLALLIFSLLNDQTKNVY